MDYWIVDLLLGIINIGFGIISNKWWSWLSAGFCLGSSFILFLHTYKIGKLFNPQ